MNVVINFFYRFDIIEKKSMGENPDDNPFNFTNLIKKLWKVNENPQNPVILSKKEIRALINAAKVEISSQPVFLELVPPVIVCGDIHGQFTDLLRIFAKCGDPSNSNYLFLGDYVDRGPQSVNTICLLLLYKIKYPQNFFLLRGNHESSTINRQYGFYEECKKNYDIKVWEWFNELFDWFPISAIIDSRILCTHGGISPSLKSVTQLKRIKRPCQVPESGLICDLLWSDPDNNCDSFNDNDRGTSYVYGFRSVEEFLEKSELELMVRAHQAIFNGYDFPFAPHKNVVTVFSAPNYRGEYGNDGAVMTVNNHLVCKFVIFAPKSEKELSEIKMPSEQNSQPEDISALVPSYAKDL